MTLIALIMLIVGAILVILGRPRAGREGLAVIGILWIIAGLALAYALQFT
jgi:hypothetical protein